MYIQSMVSLRHYTLPRNMNSDFRLLQCVALQAPHLGCHHPRYKDTSILILPIRTALDITPVNHLANRPHNRPTHIDW